jgi:peptidyl-prolyl cis-trans isomerase SurA
MRILLLIQSFCFLTWIAVAQGKETAKIQPLFSVGPSTVSVDDFLYTYRKNHQNASQDYTEKKINEYLDLFINFKLKVAERIQEG